MVKTLYKTKTLYSKTRLRCVTLYGKTLYRTKTLYGKPSKCVLPFDRSILFNCFNYEKNTDKPPPPFFMIAKNNTYLTFYNYLRGFLFFLSM